MRDRILLGDEKAKHCQQNHQPVAHKQRELKMIKNNLFKYIQEKFKEMQNEPKVETEADIEFKTLNRIYKKLFIDSNSHYLES